MAVLRVLLSGMGVGAGQPCIEPLIGEIEGWHRNDGETSDGLRLRVLDRRSHVCRVGDNDPAADQLRFHLERWADEDAVRTTGATRRFAARTIARVALAQTPRAALLGIATHGVAARAEALTQRVAPATITRRLQTVGLVVATVVLSGSQLHHTVEFALHTMI